MDTFNAPPTERARRRRPSPPKAKPKPPKLDARPVDATATGTAEGEGELEAKQAGGLKDGAVEGGQEDGEGEEEEEEDEEEVEEQDNLEEERRFYTRVGLRCEDLAVVDINAHKIFATVSPDRTLQSMKEHEMFYVYQLERDAYGEAAAAAAAAAAKPAAPRAPMGSAGGAGVPRGEEFDAESDDEPVAANQGTVKESGGGGGGGGSSRLASHEEGGRAESEGANGSATADTYAGGAGDGGAGGAAGVAKSAGAVAPASASAPRGGGREAAGGRIPPPAEGDRTNPPADRYSDGPGGQPRQRSATGAAVGATAIIAAAAAGGGGSSSAASGGGGGKGKPAALPRGNGADVATARPQPQPQAMKQIRTPVRLFAVLHRRLETNRHFLASPYRLEVRLLPVLYCCRDGGVCDDTKHVDRKVPVSAFTSLFRPVCIRGCSFLDYLEVRIVGVMYAQRYRSFTVVLCVVFLLLRVFPLSCTLFLFFHSV